MPECQDILCRTGDLLLPASVRRTLETYWVGDDRSLLYISNWSLVHLISGVVTVLLLQRVAPRWPVLLSSLLIHTGWEAWQILVQNTPWWTLRGWVDVAMDTLLFLLGVLLATRQ